MSQNPNYVYGRMRDYDPPPPQHAVYRDPDEFIDWDGRRNVPVYGNTTGSGTGCILGQGAVYLGKNIVAGDNSIAIGNDITVDKDCIVIGSLNHRKVIIGGVDILERLKKLEEMLNVLWDAPGMPGANLVCEKFIRGEN